METATLEQPVTKTRKPRVKRDSLPHIAAAKTALTKALKAEFLLRQFRERHVKAVERAEAKIKDLASQTSQAWHNLAEAATQAWQQPR